MSLPHNADLAGSRPAQPGAGLEHQALAAALQAGQPDHLAGPHFQVEAS